jgi:hypothetical protein
MRNLRNFLAGHLSQRGDRMKIKSGWGWVGLGLLAAGILNYGVIAILVGAYLAYKFVKI